MHLNIRNPRQIQTITAGMNTQDGAGVQLRRLLPAPGMRLVDPFLLLDNFRSDNPDDYIAGFPPHPHRGFETVTYLLAGKVRHLDSAGHEGLLKAGGVQWMTAGRGIEHSEMPEQERGLLDGFQLWVNLPAAQKMAEPRYQELEPEEIPEEYCENGTLVRVIAGMTAAGTVGPVTKIAAAPLFLDVKLTAEGRYSEIIPAGHNAFIYLISGHIDVMHNSGSQSIAAGQLALLSDGDGVEIKSSETSQLLLIAGEPIGEPIARHGPFVMNTNQEIEQAYRDYQDGLFGRVA
ncbi:MAG: pirin family protein [Gammaproteobacteria bacterium]|nr:pirin family protein [Gammaproteobacteria bacterium]